MTDSDANLIVEYMRRLRKTLAVMCADMLDLRETIPAVDRRLARTEKRQDLVES
ncbi:MAG: hypothetical protein AAFQ39_11610 [Pseudomonadota bacterium]